ncbi:hypothetical protein BDM02DRAFT_3100854 [Thelephora ganbajun]|uniref:Uncharacterized protein n=1 Tax=Thelephora ganbajun TaxID=370292 RepID=A0ACB6Z855_THEGA|nr:hypothetical protein BDM02DRAFT_3100854 [Thelephora ganbajun]
MLSLSIPTRDADYYISDGNTVLFVENTLFKVHRSTLTKDKSTFDTMFSLPSDSSSDSSMTVGPEGESDDNPIRLQGDTAEEFRALLWALYALPNELMVAMTDDANCMQLLHIARIAHKYQFKSIETWASAALSRYYTRIGAFEGLSTVTNDSDDANTPSLTQITELAGLCENRELLEASVDKWKRLVSEGKDVALAIGLAERLNIRPLLGLAYHSMMLNGRTNWDSEPLLTRNQKVRLFAGYYSLSKLWESMPSQTPPLVHSGRCTSQQRCSRSWAQLWRLTLEKGTGILPLQTGDVLGKLMLAESCMKAMVEGEFSSAGIAADDVPCCKENALAATSAKVAEVRESLADHFTDDF